MILLLNLAFSATAPLSARCISTLNILPSLSTACEEYEAIKRKDS
jgi:hypothetical protein